MEEELEVLSSIYGDDFILLTNASFTVTLPHPTLPAVLSVSLPETYPAAAPVMTVSSSSWLLTSTDKDAVQAVLQQAWHDAAGEVCCYQGVEAVKELLDARKEQQTAAAAALASSESVDAQDDEDGDEPQEESDQAVAQYSDDEHPPVHKAQQQPPPHQQPHAAITQSIATGQPYTDRKSVFVAHTTPIQSTGELAQLTAYLSTHPKLSRATHNITAYRLSGGSGGSYTEEGCDDDGEDPGGMGGLGGDERNEWDGDREGGVEDGVGEL